MTQPLTGDKAAGPAAIRRAGLHGLTALLRRAGRFRRSAWPTRLAGRLARFGAALGAVLRSSAALLKHLRRRWRSSLQLRVVGTTLVVSAFVVTLLGFFLMQQITADLLGQAEQVDYTQALEGLNVAQASAQSPTPAVLVGKLLTTIVGDLRSSSSNLGTIEYGVAVLPRYAQSPLTYVGAGEYNLPEQFLPPALVAQVSRERLTAPPVFEFASLPYPSAGSPRATGLLYGARFGNYELYYFFPLTQLQQELGLMLRTLAVVGLAFVFLLAGIAWLVTRWVVVPVARAAQGAQLLSMGYLDERLSVRGEDEVAALARSFNEMAASLQDKMGELENLSHSHRRFVSDVSHELRTPLTTISMAADMLFKARDQLETSAARSAELLQSQLERFEALLADLLEISRFDANAATLDLDLSDVGDLARNAAGDALQLAERRGSKIEFRLPAEELCVAEVDRRRVERILRNLLVNAVEHGEGRDVVVSAAGDRDSVAVAVRDFGVGLAPGAARLVFDRFWRADPARARTTGGTGLGLAIALEDARLHGGWLEAWGEPGRGSVFRLTLPREPGIELQGSPLPLVPGGVDLGGLMARHGELTRADGPLAEGGPPEPGDSPLWLGNGELAGQSLTDPPARPPESAQADGGACA